MQSSQPGFRYWDNSHCDLGAITMDTRTTEPPWLQHRTARLSQSDCSLPSNHVLLVIFYFTDHVPRDTRPDGLTSYFSSYLL